MNIILTKRGTKEIQKYVCQSGKAIWESS